VSFEAYSVAVRLKLVDDVSGGLLGIAGKFKILQGTIGKTQAEILALEAAWKKVKTTALIGGGMMAVGGGMLLGLKAPMEEAAKWQQEAAKFASLGFGAIVNADAERFAVGMKTYGTSARDNLTLLSDAMAVFKDLSHAEMAAPIMAKMKFANEAVFGEGAGGNEAKFMDMMKVAEMRGGLKSPEEFKAQANTIQQVISGSRNRVDATQLLQALKTGGVALAGMSNDQFYLGSEPLIQEFGGQRFGTAMMSAYQNLVQSRGSVGSQQELYRLGLLDKSKVEFNALGGVKKALPGAFTGSKLWDEGRNNPLTVLNEVLLPAFKKAGITSDPDIINEIGRIFSNRTASNLYARAYQQRASLQNQWEANRNAQGIDQLSDTAKNTPQGKFIELQKKWADAERELGLVVLPLATRAAEGLTDALKWLTDAMRNNPITTKVMVLAFTALGALFVVGGAAMVMTAGLGALRLALFGLSPAVASAAGPGGLGGILGTVVSMVKNIAGAVGGGSVLSTLGRAGSVAAVGAIAYEATDLIANKWLHLDQKLGNLLNNFAGNEYKNESPHIAKKKDQPVIVRSPVYIDGRVATDIFSGHQADNMGPLGGEMFDPTLSLPPVGLNFAR
jgi:hypothetical protein